MRLVESLYFSSAQPTAIAFEFGYRNYQNKCSARQFNGALLHRDLNKFRFYVLSVPSTAVTKRDRTAHFHEMVFNSGKSFRSRSGRRRLATPSRTRQSTPSRQRHESGGRRLQGARHRSRYRRNSRERGVSRTRRIRGSRHRSRDQHHSTELADSGTRRIRGSRHRSRDRSHSTELADSRTRRIRGSRHRSRDRSHSTELADSGTRRLRVSVDTGNHEILGSLVGHKDQQCQTEFLPQQHQASLLGHIPVRSWSEWWRLPAEIKWRAGSKVLKVLMFADEFMDVITFYNELSKSGRLATEFFTAALAEKSGCLLDEDLFDALNNIYVSITATLRSSVTGLKDVKNWVAHLSARKIYICDRVDEAFDERCLACSPPASESAEFFLLLQMKSVSDALVSNMKVVLDLIRTRKGTKDVTMPWFINREQRW